MNDDICLVFDLETLDTAPTGVILSIGIVMFNIKKRNSFEELISQGFNIYFSQKEQLDKRRTTSQATLNWWEQQGEIAKECLNNPRQVTCDKLHIYLAAFYKAMDYQPDCKKTRWFSRGSFDEKFLSSFCQTFEIDTPYKYWTWRCSRSFLDGAGIGTRNEKLDKPTSMIKHNSHHDAAFEALMIQQLFNKEN